MDISRGPKTVWRIAARARTALTIALVLGATSCHRVRAQARAVERSRTAPAPADVSRLLDSLRGNAGLPALAIALVRADGIVAEGAAGVRVLGRPGPVERGDAFHIGSVGKSMTATMLATLVDEGRLSWSTTAAEVIPGLRAVVHPVMRQVTLAQLLAHEAGLPPFAEDSAAEYREQPPFTGTQLARRRAFATWLLARPPVRPPGTVYQYSNAGPTVAAAMAEAVTGKSWQTLMQERLFGPLGLGTAGFGSPARARPAAALGHAERNRRLVPEDLSAAAGWSDPSGIEAPAGDVHMSVEDLARFAHLHLRGLSGHPRLLRSQTFARLHTPGVRAALGWGRQQMDGVTTSTHTGGNGTFYAVIVVSPEQGWAFVGVANADVPAAARALRAARVELVRRYTERGGGGGPP